MFPNPRTTFFQASVAFLFTLIVISTPAYADSGAYRALTINSPSIPVESPFTVNMSASSNVSTISTCMVYLDNVLYTQVNSATLKVQVAAPVGAHRITVQCYDSKDNWTKQSFYVQVVSLSSTAHSVGLTWNASTGATGYNLYRSSNGTSYSKLNISTLAARGYTDDTVNSGATYYYYVTAINSLGQESSPSTSAKAVIP